MLAVQEPKRLTRQNLMIESLNIKNFRSFENLSLSGFGKLNIVVGENSSGKTTLLEAIFLCLVGGPDAMTRFRQWRGLGGMPTIQRTRSAYEELWKENFFRLEVKRTIEISCQGYPETRRHLKMYYSPQAVMGTFSPVSGSGSSATSEGMPGDSTVIVPVLFELSDGKGGKTVNRIEISQAGLLGGMLSGNLVPSAPCGYYPSSFTGIASPQEAAKQYSDLSKVGKEESILSTLQQVYPEIQKLSHELNAGISMMYCKVPEIEEKLPVGIVSGGIHKLLGLMLGISALRRGVILIDELENGFYYKALPKVWEALLAFAKTFDVQIFASTHSAECLKAATGMLDEHESAFRLLRVEKEEGKSIVRIFPGESLRAAIESDIEVR